MNADAGTIGGSDGSVTGTAGGVTGFGFHGALTAGGDVPVGTGSNAAIGSDAQPRYAARRCRGGARGEVTGDAAPE